MPGSSRSTTGPRISLLPAQVRPGSRVGVVLCDSQDGWEQKTRIPKQVTRAVPRIPCISRRQACMVGKGKFASLWRKTSGDG